MNPDTVSGNVPYASVPEAIDSLLPADVRDAGWSESDIHVHQCCKGA